MKTLIIILILLFSNTAYAHPIDMNALATIESNNNPKACSYKGCKYGRGLYQISEIVLKQYDLERPKNLRIGVDGWIEEIKRDPYRQTMIADYYLEWIHERVGNLDDTLICWNWGYGNWSKWNRNGSNYNKLPKETKDFLKKYNELTKEEK